MNDIRTPRVFFDSNVLFYSEDRRYPRKQNAAQSLIRSHRVTRSGTVSLQVLGEYYSNVTRKLGLDPAIARRKVEIFSRFHLVEPTLTDIFAAIDLSRLQRLSYYDSLIVHCAKKSGCPIVLSEDMQHGQLIDGVRIVNPFIETA
jgi:predicted nucleic acid-binding protein